MRCKVLPNRDSLSGQRRVIRDHQKAARLERGEQLAIYRGAVDIPT